MDQNTEKKLEEKNNILNFYKNHKIKIYFMVFILLTIIITLIFFNYKNNKSNVIIAEKYIEAGLYLASKDKEKSKEIYKEIILSKNKFYSLLSLNNIIDNNLEENSEKVLKLFDVVENMRINNERKNLIKLKKALYLKKIFKNNEANKLITEIIKDNSIWKDISEILK